MMLLFVNTTVNFGVPTSREFFGELLINFSINALLLLLSVLLAQMFLTFWMFHVFSFLLLTCM
jgi:hypothetical protein